MKKIVSSIALLSFAAGAPFAGAAMVVYPSPPRAGQDIVLHFDSTMDCGATGHVGSAAVSGSTITVSYTTTVNCGVVPPGSWLNAAVRVPAAGTYTVVEHSQSGSTQTDGQITVLPALSAARTGTSLAGLWFIPTQPGWGVNIAEGDSGQLFLTWFTYGGAPNPDGVSPGAWYYTSGGVWNTANQFVGGLAVSFGADPSRPFDASKVVTQPAGMTTVSVNSQDSITFAVQGNLGTEFAYTYNLTRYHF